jgi:hypothetical protein
MPAKQAPARNPVDPPSGKMEAMAVAPVSESGAVDAPPPISPSTSVLTLLLALGGILLVGLALVGGLYATVSHATKKAPTSTTVAVAAPSAATGAASAVRPLSDVVVSATPSDYTPVDPGVVPNGPFDINGFAQFAENPAADRVAFERNGFVGGFARSWRRTGPLGESRLVATVFEFSTASGAKTIEEYESGRTVREDGGVPFTLSGANALQFEHKVGKTTIHGYAVTIRREGDTRLYYLTALYPTQLPPAEIIELTRQQQRRLRAGG